jgi:hypothetical protein
MAYCGTSPLFASLAAILPIRNHRTPDSRRPALTSRSPEIKKGHGVLPGSTGNYCAGRGSVSCYAFTLPGPAN